MRERTVGWMAAIGALALGGASRADGPPTVQLVSTTACTVCHAGGPPSPGGAGVQVLPGGEHLAVLGAHGGSPHIAFIDLDSNIDRQTGLTLATADAEARRRWKLPEGRGLVIAAVAPDGPAAAVGLRVGDVLLAVGDTPLAEPDDLVEGLKAAGEEAVTISGLRDGKPLKVEVRPVHRVGFGPVAKPEPSDYYIGVPVQPPDEVLRSHLDLPDGQGLVVTDVVADSPAARAGLKKNDILLSLDDKPLTDVEALRAGVQAGEGQAVAVKLLRGGKPMTVEVKPEPRPMNERDAQAWDRAFGYIPGLKRRYFAGRLDYPPLKPLSTMPNPVQRWDAQVFKYPVTAGQVGGPDDVKKRLDELTEQVRALRQTVEDLRKAGK